MPVKQIRVSSLSGDEIPDGTGARVRVIYNDPERTDHRADLTDAEAEKLVQQYKAEQVEPRPERRGARRMRL
jgi:hypothetical protein